jgi:endonuclease/exonuclease/phosphatase family metal-dependent hydrolase
MFAVKNKIPLYIILTTAGILIAVSCSSADVFTGASKNPVSFINGNDNISLVTYNIKAIYEKEEEQIDKVMEFVNDEKYDFVLFQELFNENTRDYILEKTDTSFYRSIISRVDYNSFPSFIFQDAGLFMMGRYPIIDLSEVEFDDDICQSNGVIHMILDKEFSKTNDFLANKSVLGVLFEINDSSQVFLFTTHVQAIGSREHKNFQMEQIRGFIENAVERVLSSGTVKSSENLAVILAGDFNNNAYSFERFQNMLKLLGSPKDLHMEHNGNKQEYTFRFRSGRPSRRFDYILAYDFINSFPLKKVYAGSSNVVDLKDNTGESISDHSALRAVIKID